MLIAPSAAPEQNRRVGDAEISQFLHQRQISCERGFVRVLGALPDQVLMERVRRSPSCHWVHGEKPGAEPSCSIYGFTSELQVSSHGRGDLRVVRFHPAGVLGGGREVGAGRPAGPVAASLGPAVLKRVGKSSGSRSFLINFNSLRHDRINARNAVVGQRQLDPVPIAHERAPDG